MLPAGALASEEGPALDFVRGTGVSLPRYSPSLGLSKGCGSGLARGRPRGPPPLPPSSWHLGPPPQPANRYRGLGWALRACDGARADELSKDYRAL